MCDSRTYIYIYVFLEYVFSLEKICSCYVFTYDREYVFLPNKRCSRITLNTDFKYDRMICSTCYLVIFWRVFCRVLWEYLGGYVGSMLRYVWDVLEGVFRTFLGVTRPIHNIKRYYDFVICLIGILGYQENA